MTIGIYALYWEEQDLIYIGQSVEIETRFIRHLWHLRLNTHSNKRVQSAYNRHGLPALEILERCNSNELNNLEIQWTEEFDSINRGLNIVAAGDSASGTTAKNSKYSKVSILKIFSLLYRTTEKHSVVAEKLHVPLHLVDDIASGRVHYWLQEEYPEKFALLISNRYLRVHCRKPQKQVSNRVHKALISPTGIKYTNINNVMGFCKDNNFINIQSATSKILAVLNEQRKSYLGWHLEKE